MLTKVPENALIPKNSGVVVVALPYKSKPPIMLLAILNVLLVPPPVRIPIAPPLVVDTAVNVIAPFTVFDPIVFPNVVPKFTCPFTIFTAQNAIELVLAEVKLKLEIVLFCMEVGVPKPTDKSTAVNKCADVPAMV